MVTVNHYEFWNQTWILKETDKSDNGNPDLSTVAPQPRIGQDLQPETDFVVIENRQNGDGDAEEADPECSI